MDHCFVSIPIAKFNTHSLSFYLSLEINFFTSKLKNSTKKKNSVIQRMATYWLSKIKFIALDSIVLRYLHWQTVLIHKE